MSGYVSYSGKSTIGRGIYFPAAKWIGSSISMFGGLLSAIFRADTTKITADSTELTADYSR